MSATEAVETQGNRSVFAMEAVATRGKGGAFAAKSVEHTANAVFLSQGAARKGGVVTIESSAKQRKQWEHTAKTVGAHGKGGILTQRQWEHTKAVSLPSSPVRSSRYRG